MEDIGILVSSVIILYGSMIYILLSFVDINIENILLVSIVTAWCIITYELSYKFCNVMYELLRERKMKKNEN
jgi:hypothetical protein